MNGGLGKEPYIPTSISLQKFYKKKFIRNFVTIGGLCYNNHMSGPRPHLKIAAKRGSFKGKTHANTKWKGKKAGKGYLIKKLAREVAFGDSTSFRQALEKVGYSKTYVDHKGNEIKNSPALKAELEAIGFTEDAAKAKLSAIMNSETVYEMITPENQLRAIDMAFKVFGTYAPEKNIDVKASLSEIIEAAKKISGQTE